MKVDRNSVDWSELFYYDETSPSCLKRAKDVLVGRGRGRLMFEKGSDVTNLCKNGYYQVSVGGRGNKKDYKVHRIIWMMLVGEIPKDKMIDHIDGNITNNIISNLRLVSNAVNSRNRRKSKNCGEVMGVHYRKVPRKDGSYNEFWQVVKQSFKDSSIKGKVFNIGILGNEEAFRQACEYRKKVILFLNEHGAEYSDRHGE